MKRNRYKEIDEKAYEIFKFFKEKAREIRYGEITLTLTMHDGYPVKINWDTYAPSKDGISELTLYCPIKRDPVTGEIIYKKKTPDSDKTDDSSEKKT